MLFRSNDTATTEIYTSVHTLSLHDALPILVRGNSCDIDIVGNHADGVGRDAVRIDINPRAGCRVGCAGNTVSGSAKLDTRCTAPVEAKR